MFARIDIDYLSSPESCTLKRVKRIQDNLSVICFASPNNRSRAKCSHGGGFST